MAVIYLQKLLRGRVVQNTVCRVQPLVLCFSFENRFIESVCTRFLGVNSLLHPAVLWNCILLNYLPTAFCHSLSKWVAQCQGEKGPACCLSQLYLRQSEISIFLRITKSSNFLT